MPRTKKPKPEASSQDKQEPPFLNGSSADVLNLAETAAYLRLSESEVVALVQTQDLPGRRVGSEWRFLKSAIQDWLRTGTRTKSNKEAWMELAGVWKDDPYVDEELKETYRQRGRPLTEDAP